MTVKRIPGDGRKKLDAIKNIASKTIEVGWFASNKYEDGTPVAYVASIHEFGHADSGIPPRSFMRTTVAEKSDEWKSKGATILRNIDSADAAAELMGAMVAGDIRAKIAEITEPPLSERTIAARKKRGNSNTKPLVDTRILLPTLTHQVS